MTQSAQENGASAAAERASSDPRRLANFVDGQFVLPALAASQDGAIPYIVSPNPATGKPHVLVPNSTVPDVDLAVAAAKRAFPAWSKTPRAERSRLLLAIADGIEKRLDEFARAESMDQGKPVSLAKRVDIPRAVHNFRFFASAMMNQAERTTDLDQVAGAAPGNFAINYVRREPVGVAGLISPWNLPLYLLTWKIAPCLATGNTCVCKPSEFTSHTAFLLCEVMRDVGLPAGVVNMVFGDGPQAGATLVAHGDVPIISFTGGTVTGKRIAAVAAPMFKKLSLELGGKNAGVIFGDADLSRAIPGCRASAFTNQGEICLCTSRLLVHRSIYDEFVAKYVALVKQLKVGDPTDASTDVDALVSEQHMEKVLSYIELAKQEGGQIMCGGRRVPGKEGYFVEPTVITGLSPTSRVNTEEIFGPVVTIWPFDDESEAVSWANGVEYGLSCCVWTQNVSVAHRVAAKVHAGTVWVNCWMIRDLRMPFGGVKASGTGREGWPSSLEVFTEEKTVCVFVEDAGAQA